MLLDNNCRLCNSRYIWCNTCNSFYYEGILEKHPMISFWMMIAGSPTLRDLHDRAYEWLMTHGHEADAKVFLLREKKLGPKPADKGKQGPAKKRF